MPERLTPLDNRNRAHFGLYADPDALPEVDELPAALSESLAALA